MCSQCSPANYEVNEAVFASVDVGDSTWVSDGVSEYYEIPTDMDTPSSAECSIDWRLAGIDGSEDCVVVCEQKRGSGNKAYTVFTTTKGKPPFCVGSVNTTIVEVIVVRLNEQWDGDWNRTSTTDRVEQCADCGCDFVLWVDGLSRGSVQG